MPVTSIIRVSTAADGTQGDGGSFSPVFSPDGTKVAFFGYPSNFVTGDTNGNLDIFVKTLATGAIDRVSTDAAVAQANGDSLFPVFSPDGTKVFFESAASNLAPGDTNGANDIYAKTLATGAIERVSSDAMGAPGDGLSSGPVSFSLDGTKVAFSSEASNFVAGDTIPWTEVFVKTLATGAFERASTDAMGVGGNSSSYGPVLSPDGTKVAFTSNASNLVPGDTNGTEDIFLKTLATGAIARISTDAAGAQANGGSSNPVFSPDGTKVAFASGASNLVPGDTNGTSDIFVKTLATGAIARISTDAAGVQGNGACGGPTFSPDGTKVAFFSDASNLVPGDTNGTGDNFVKTLATGAISVVTIAADSVHPEAFSLPYPFLFSPDWTKVAFGSLASDIVPNDTNNADDIFVVTLATPPTTVFHNISDNTDRSQFKAAYAGDDSIDGTGGADRIRGWAGRDTILGEGGNDEIRGDGVGLPYDPDLPDTDPVKFADSIQAGAGNDSVWGGGGNDTLLGEDGSDRLYGQGGGDSIDGGRGADEINGAENNDTCRGGADNDWIAGGPGLDSLYGDDGNDKIYAFAPDSEASRWGWIDDGTGDQIEGGNGNDTLIGGKGVDTLTGGAGADVFVFAAMNDSGKQSGQLFSLSSGTPLITSSSNDIVGSGASLRNNAELSTTECNVQLGFFFLGSESAFTITLATAFGNYTEVDTGYSVFPLGFPGTLLFAGTQASAALVTTNFTSPSYAGAIGNGSPLGNGSLAFAYLKDLTTFAISETPTNYILFGLDDPGSNDGDYDDFMGVITATGLTADVITDFEHGRDKIDLHDFDASTVRPGNNAFLWRGTGPFTTSGEGELHYQKYDNAGTANDYTVIFGDTDADTASEFQIKLQGLVTLSQADFIL
ncbi:MAG: PD40 domain-containing protein [Rhodospirillales bacterium]|nr:PD40 domain-containing protein [Rhodospirillales bacterium]